MRCTGAGSLGKRNVQINISFSCFVALLEGYLISIACVKIFYRILYI